MCGLTVGSTVKVADEEQRAPGHVVLLNRGNLLLTRLKARLLLNRGFPC